MRHYCTHCGRKRREDVMGIHSKSVCNKMSWACTDKIGCYAAAAIKRRGVQLDWVELLQPRTTFCRPAAYYIDQVSMK